MTLPAQESDACRYFGCSQPATVTIEYPAVTRGLQPFVSPFCDEHAEEIMSEGMVFPGARVVSVHAS